MKIVSLNAFESPLSRTNRLRFETLKNELIRLNPDIICLQEIIRAKTAKALSAFFQRRGYQTFAQPKRLFNHGGLWCAVKLPILSYSFTCFKKQGVLISIQAADRMIHKGYQTIDCGRFTLIHSHLVCMHNPRRKRQILANYSQAQELFRQAGKYEQVIMTGDFNFTPYDGQYKKFCRKSRYLDPLETMYAPTISPQNTNRKHSRIWPKHSIRVDYTLISKNMGGQIRKQKIIFDKPYSVKKKLIHVSDHYGIMTELAI